MLEPHKDTNASVAAMSTLRSSAQRKSETSFKSSTTLSSRPSIARAKSDSFLQCTRTKRSTTAPPKKSALKHSNSAPPSSGRVKFGMVDIREYPIIPGDNPGGNEGVPVTIDWCVQRNVTANVAEYEEGRPKRRTAAEFHMPPEVRYALLKNSGVSVVEINKYTKKANIVRAQRRMCVEFSHMEGISEAKERMTRGLKNLTPFGKDRKQKERAFIQQTTKSGNQKEMSKVTTKTAVEVTKPVEQVKVLERRESSQKTVAETLCPEDEEEICA